MTTRTHTRKRTGPGGLSSGPRSLWLRVAFDPHGARLDEVIEVPRSGLLVGRDGGCGLPLDDDLVSRQHAVIRARRGGGFVVEDLGSSNGTTVGGLAISERSLSPGDTLRVGDTVLLALDAAPRPWRTDHGLHGRSDPMYRLRDQIARLAPLELPVLVRGPTGAGKELVATALHRASGRMGPIVPVNAAALPPNLIESALFGHRKGAFTSATADALGAFRSAHRGTLFLDEIGDMPLELQARLLRVLEAGEVTPVGASRPVPVEVRVVAATHVALEQAVERGHFREDLLARLGALELPVPPLSERRDDIVGLAEALLPADAGPPRWSADVVEALLCWSWPRQVRELRNVMARLGVLAPAGRPWQLEDLPEAMRRPSVASASPGQSDGQSPEDEAAVHRPAGDLFAQITAPPDRPTLLALLEAVDGNVSELGRRVGRSRKQVYRWMRRVGLTPGQPPADRDDS